MDAYGLVQQKNKNDVALTKIERKRKTQISRKNKRSGPGRKVTELHTTHVPPSQTKRQNQTRKGSGGEATAAVAAARASSACRRTPGAMALPLRSCKHHEAATPSRAVEYCDGESVR